MTKPNIWVDADACPIPIKSMLCRAANRSEIRTTFVANQYIKLPPSRFIHFIQVRRGFDVADDEISTRIKSGDLVMTQDIPLAAEGPTKEKFC